MQTEKMSFEYAIKLLHPETTGAAIAEIEYYHGFSGKKAAIQAISDAGELACEAMEKQIPKKPVWKYEPCKYPDRTTMVKCLHCPDCGELLDFHYSIHKHPYCWKCGKALDWGE